MRLKETMKELNEKNFFDHSYWQFLNRKELRSLVYYLARYPVLPSDHLLEGIFQTWYCASSATIINPRHTGNEAFGKEKMPYIHREDKRVVWSIGEIFRFPTPGQVSRNELRENKTFCQNTGQEVKIKRRISPSVPCLKDLGKIVFNNPIRLFFTKKANLSPWPITRDRAFEVTRDHNKKTFRGFSNWWLPRLDELENYVGVEYHSPALSFDHPFDDVKKIYWSSTSNFYEPLCARLFYSHKGDKGVFLKNAPHFYVWAIRRNLKEKP